MGFEKKDPMDRWSEEEEVVESGHGNPIEYFPKAVAFNDKTYPTTITFNRDVDNSFLNNTKQKLITTLKGQLTFWQRLRLGSKPNIDHWITIEGNQLKFSPDACKAGAIELFFQPFRYGKSYKGEVLKKAVSYLSTRAKNTDNFYSFFGRLFGFSRQKRCDDTWSMIQSLIFSMNKKPSLSKKQQSSTSTCYTTINHFSLIEEDEDKIALQIEEESEKGNYHALKLRLAKITKKARFFPRDRELNLLDNLVSFWPEEKQPGKEGTSTSESSSPKPPSVTEMLDLFVAELFPKMAKSENRFFIDLHVSHLIYARAEHLGYSSISQEKDRTTKARIKSSINHLGIECCDPDLVVFNKNNGFHVYLLPDQQKKLQVVIESIKKVIDKYKSIEALITEKLKETKNTGDQEKIEKLKHDFYKACAHPKNSKVLTEFLRLINKKMKNEPTSPPSTYLQFLMDFQKEVSKVSVVESADHLDDETEEDEIRVEMKQQPKEVSLPVKIEQEEQEDVVLSEVKIIPLEEIKSETQLVGANPLHDFKKLLHQAIETSKPIENLSQAIHQIKTKTSFTASNEEIKKVLYGLVRTLPDFLLTEELKRTGKDNIDPLLKSVIEEYQSIKHSDEKKPHPLITAIREAKPVKEIRRLCQQFNLHAQDIRVGSQKTLIDILLADDYYKHFSFIQKPTRINDLKEKQFTLEKQAAGGGFKYWVKDSDGTLFQGTMTEECFEKVFGYEHKDVRNYIDGSNIVNLERYASRFLKHFSKVHPKIEQNKHAYVREVLSILVENEVPINRTLNQENFLGLYRKGPKFFKSIIGLLVQAGSISRPEFSEAEARHLGLIEATCFSSVARYLIKFHNANPGAALSDLVDEFFLEENIDKKGDLRPPLKHGNKWLLSPAEVEKEIIKWELVFNKNSEGPIREIIDNYLRLIRTKMAPALDLKNHDQTPAPAGAVPYVDPDFRDLPPEMIAMLFRTIFTIGKDSGDSATNFDFGPRRMQGDSSSSSLFRYIRDEKDALRQIMMGYSVYHLRPTHSISTGDSKDTSIVIKSLIDNNRRDLTIYLGGCPALGQLVMQKGETLLDIFIKNIKLDKNNIADHIHTLKFLIEDHALPANKIFSDNELASLFSKTDDKSLQRNFFTMNIALLVSSMASSTARNCIFNEKIYDGFKFVRRLKQGWKGNDGLVKNINVILKKVCDKKQHETMHSVLSSPALSEERMLDVLEALLSELNKVPKENLFDRSTIALSFAFNKVLTHLYLKNNAVDPLIQDCLAGKRKKAPGAASQKKKSVNL